MRAGESPQVLKRGSQWLHYTLSQGTFVPHREIISQNTQMVTMSSQKNSNILVTNNFDE